MSNDSNAKYCLIAGETGDCDYIIDNNDLKTKLNAYLKELEIPQNEITIINNFANSFLHLNSSNFELKPNSKFFFYWKRYKKEIIEFQKNQIQKKLNKILSDIKIPENLFLYKVEISSLLKIIEKHKNIFTSTSDFECTYGDIILINENLLRYYDAYFDIYKNFISSNCIFDFIKKNYERQTEGISILNELVIKKYEECNQKFSKFFDNSNTLKKSNDHILKIYEENITKLKKLELHPCVIKFLSNYCKDKEKIKYLIDIYFNENDMNIWRDNCIKNEEMLFNKATEKQKFLFNEKDKILEYGNSFINKLKSEWSVYMNKYQKIYQDNNKQFISAFEDIKNDYNLFIDSIQKITQQINEYTTSKKNNKIDIKEFSSILKNKYLNTTLNINEINSMNTPFNDFLNKAKKYSENLYERISDYFSGIRFNKNYLEKLIEKIDTYSKNLVSIKHDFEFLEAPGKFIISYNNTLAEIQRRIIFNIKLFPTQIKKIENFINIENLERNKFLNNNKKYLSPAYIKLFNLENPVNFKLNILNNNEMQIYNCLIDCFDINNFNNINDDNNETIEKLLNHIKEIETSLNIKIKESLEYQNKYENLENNFIQLDKDIKNMNFYLDELSDNFNFLLSVKDSQINELNQQIENLKSQIKNKDVNCPLCNEYCENFKEYQNTKSLFSDMEQKIKFYYNQNKNLEMNYKNLANNFLVIKRTFFNNMNIIIAQNNKETMNFKSKYENKLMMMEDLLSGEKIFNKVNKVENSNKYKSKLKDIQLEKNNLCNEIDYLKKYNNELKNKNNILTQNYQNLNQTFEKLKLTKYKKNSVDQGSHRTIDQTINSATSLSTIAPSSSNLRNIKTIGNNYSANDLIILNNTNDIDDGIISYKKISKGSRCIFVPFSEGIFVCINLSNELLRNTFKPKESSNYTNFYECKYILDLNSFNKDLKKIIIDNSLIVIGRVGKLSELKASKSFYFLGLPEDKKFISVTLEKIDYVIGFPEDEILFKNYLN